MRTPAHPPSTLQAGLRAGQTLGDMGCTSAKLSRVTPRAVTPEGSLQPRLGSASPAETPQSRPGKAYLPSAAAQMGGKRLFLFPGLIPASCRDLWHSRTGSGTLRGGRRSQPDEPEPCCRRRGCQSPSTTLHTPKHPSKMKSTQEHPWDAARSCPCQPEPCRGLGQHRVPSPARSPGSPAASSLIIARLPGRQRSAGLSQLVCRHPRLGRAKGSSDTRHCWQMLHPASTLPRPGQHMPRPSAPR